MSIDWIPIRGNLSEDPAVLRMADYLKTRPEHIVGYLVKFWDWASANSIDGRIEGVTIDGVESVLNLPHFLHMLRRVGWLDYEEASGETGGLTLLVVPKFDRWLSRGAKKRLQNTRNQQLSRSEDDKSVTKVRPHNKTQQNILLLLREREFGDWEKKAHATACHRLGAKPCTERALLLARVILLDGIADGFHASEVVQSLDDNKPKHWPPYIRAIVARHFGVSKTEAAELIDAADPRRRVEDASDTTD